MIFPSNRVRIMIATKPVDFRKGHDGLIALGAAARHPVSPSATRPGVAVSTPSRSCKASGASCRWMAMPDTTAFSSRDMTSGWPTVGRTQGANWWRSPGPAPRRSL